MCYSIRRRKRTDLVWEIEFKQSRDFNERRMRNSSLGMKQKIIFSNNAGYVEGNGDVRTDGYRRRRRIEEAAVCETTEAKRRRRRPWERLMRRRPKRSDGGL